MLARYHIWPAKSRETLPIFEYYTRFVKSRYEMKTKGSDIKKWELLAEYIN